VRWTPQASDDLESIAEFIAVDSAEYASLFVMDVVEAVERIGRFPEIGRVVPEARKMDAREVILGNYRIVYRQRMGAVEIITIYHTSRLLDPSKLK